jgi:hypothetical protein
MQKELERADYVNKLIYTQKIIQRKEDMSPNGNLTLIVQDDGDICLQIFDEEGMSACIEFCTPVMGGGGSTRTHKALRELMVAMIEDQNDNRQNARNGRFEIESKLEGKINE